MGEFEVMPSLEDRGPSQVVRPLTIRGNGRFRQDGFGGAKHGASERRLLMPLRGAIFLRQFRAICNHRGRSANLGSVSVWIVVKDSISWDNSKTWLELKLPSLA